MKLYTRVVVLLCAIFAAYGIVDYTIQREVILPSFESLESEIARTDMERVTRALDRELTQLMEFSADWGNWIDTYEYMRVRNPDFIEVNMNPSFLESSGIELVAFLDPEGRFVWRQGYAAKGHDPVQFQLLDAEGLEPSHPFLPSVRDGLRAKGIVLTEHGPMLLTLAPILDGNGKGPHRGAVLMGRLLSPKRIAQLAEQAQVRLTVRTQRPSAHSSAAMSEALVPTTPIVRRADINEVFREVPGIYGQRALLLRIEVPRSVTAKGLAATHFALGSLLVAGVIVLLVLILAIRQMILKPVSRMTRHAVRIAEHDDLTVRLALDRRDELGVLAREFDTMVDKLADARRRLVDHSFEAGAAQIASGVLHNVGNAMTPLGVTVAGMQKRLREAPADDVALVLAELDKGAGDERRADLEEFLRLTSRELAQAVTQARSEVDAVARQAEAIQLALTQQLRSNHAAPLIEAVRLPDLVERAIEMVPTTLRPYLVIQVDPSLQAMRTVHIPRITLQQVFQNLIQNAAEAMRDAGRARGHLRVSGAIVAGPDGDCLRLSFTDDGAGIAADHLPRIFERGFSTKSRESNSGIGLHWCANAISAFGGSLRAGNSEHGQGATFVIVLPLRESGTGVARAA